MGLAGAEDKSFNAKFIAYLNQRHCDVAEHFYLTTDSIMSIASAFDKSVTAIDPKNPECLLGGVTIICGTGSTCRLLKADGSIHGVGGWGHMIDDYGNYFYIFVYSFLGSGFWISLRYFLLVCSTFTICISFVRSLIRFWSGLSFSYVFRKSKFRLFCCSSS